MCPGFADVLNSRKGNIAVRESQRQWASQLPPAVTPLFHERKRLIGTELFAMQQKPSAPQSQSLTILPTKFGATKGKE